MFQSKIENPKSKIMSDIEFNAKGISPWPHRLAVALALVTFPLIWVGGLVTTYDAGMAVPDWPGTYGYNLFAYPWTTWIAGPWDLFIEHGHRLLGAVAGLVSMALVAVVFRTDDRRWPRLAAIGGLALVMVQGVLGGARVLMDERMVALIHACLGPLFFAYLAALVVATSLWWNELECHTSSIGLRLVQSAWIVAGVAYGQLVLGAVLRHVPLSASPQVFRLALVFHLILAGALVIQIGIAAIQAWWPSNYRRGLRLPGVLLVLLVLVQVVLGLATYVAKYSWPAWLGEYQFAAAFVVQEKSLAQSLITTGHVANGSLIVFVAVFFAMRAIRIAVLSTQYAVRSTRLDGPGSSQKMSSGLVAAL
jgi:cytochrome c oxidase assembly protein subunit 15